jgi:hypothetical protein
VTGDATFGPWRRSLDQIERAAERRELKALATVFCGQKHSLVRALRAAQNGDADALAVALREIDALPALPRRRLLATFAAPPECSSRCSPIYTTSTGKHIMNDEFVFRPFKYSNLPVDVANPQQTNAEAQRRAEVE